jgi:hypothetical protein
MGRELALGYGTNRRVSGDPGKDHTAALPRNEYFGSRNVRAVNADLPFQEPEPATCSATTKAGDPCKARPAEGESLCTFHKE